jgi:hypothetical protein
MKIGNQTLKKDAEGNRPFALNGHDGEKFKKWSL